MTFEVVSPTKSKKRSSNRNKRSSFTRRVVKNNRQESCLPLLPEITGIRVGSQAKQDEILTNGGQIQVEELWTTEALIDKLAGLFKSKNLIQEDHHFTIGNT